jgi:hypothetical protein
LLTGNIEYWIKKGFDEEEAKLKVIERQSTFSKEICIKKYGEIEGLEKWQERQDKWLQSYNDKTAEELHDINRRKSNQMSFTYLWTNKAVGDGMFYILDIADDKVKIGITVRTLRQRYRKAKFEVIKTYESDISHCFQIEQLLKQKLKDYFISKKEEVEDFGWTETFNKESLPIILEFCEEYFNNHQKTLDLFKETFELNHAENFNLIQEYL